MPRYWYRQEDGHLVGQAPDGAIGVGHSEYGRTPDLVLPGPVKVCRWDGTAVVVDGAALARVKTVLRERVEEKALGDLQQGVLTTPQGDFRVRRDDLESYTLIGFAALYAIQTSAPFSITLRRADDSSVTLNAQQFVRLLALAGERMAGRLAARDARLDQLAAATAEDLKTFVP